MIAKHIVSLGSALFFGVLVFFTMQLMIASDGLFEKPDRNQTYLDFVRVDPNTQETQVKDRRIPDPPKPPEKPPQTPDAEADFDNNTTAMNMDLPNINTSISQGDGPSFGSLGGGGGMSGFDTDVIPMVRPNPKYPPRALQAGIEGYVILDVTIDADGSVSAVSVIESKPKRLFDREAIRAMKRWKFRPKIVDGKPQPQRAKQKLEFNLNK